jgi:hypothetical protein
LKYTKKLQDLGLRATNLKIERSILEVENQKLKEDQKKKEEYHKAKCKALEERCQIYERNRTLAEEQHQEEVARLRKLQLEELQALRKDALRKNKELEDCTNSINADKNFSDSRIKELTIELNNLKANKEKELEALEKRMRNDYAIKIAGNGKVLDAKLSQLEKSREELETNNKRNIEKLWDKTKQDSSTIEEMEKELAKAKEELLVAQKENATLRARVQQAQYEQHMTTSTMERFDSNRKSLSEEIKKLKATDKTQLARLKEEQNKERQAFEQMRMQLNRELHEAVEENIRRRAEAVKARQEANQLSYNLVKTIKEVIGESANEYKQTI